VLRLFEHYHWPGNVRQLFNVLRTACVMAGHRARITREHLSDDFLEDALASACPRAVAPRPSPPRPPAPPAARGRRRRRRQRRCRRPRRRPAGGRTSPSTARTFGDMEIDAIRKAVADCGGNISEASKRLGISRNTIYRKLRWK
jgi:transcriptional regulator of acetoin/glycerol metabolism